LTIERKEVIPALLLICPLNIGIWGGSCLRGAIVVNASEGGFLIETVSDIPVGRELNITVLYAMGFELANFKVVAKIVRKEPYCKEDWKGNQHWEGYQHGLELIQILDEDRWKLNLLLGGRFEFEEILPSLCS